MAKDYRVIDLGDGPLEGPPPSNDNDDRHIAVLADYVREIYIACRARGARNGTYEPGPTWDGGVTQYGRRHTSVWPRVARWILQHSCEPMAYIQAQFDMNRSEYAPQPNQLTNDAALAKYARYQEGIDSRLALEYTVGCERVRLNIGFNCRAGDSPEIAVARTITNTLDVNISSLLRYCFAVEYGMSAIAETWHDRALYYYAFQREAIDRVWPANVVPASLKQEANKMLEAITGAGR